MFGKLHSGRLLSSQETPQPGIVPIGVRPRKSCWLRFMLVIIVMRACVCVFSLYPFQLNKLCCHSYSHSHSYSQFYSQSIPASSIGKIPLLNCLLCFRIELSLSHWFFTRHLLTTSRDGQIINHLGSEVLQTCASNISIQALSICHMPLYTYLSNVSGAAASSGECSLESGQPGIIPTSSFSQTECATLFRLCRWYRRCVSLKQSL